MSKRLYGQRTRLSFIQQYLRIFVHTTKHGAYIDGFAGHRDYDQLDSWAAALVLGSEPKWLRHFFLCELKPKGVAALQKLQQEQSGLRDRKAGTRFTETLKSGVAHFNQNVEKILGGGKDNTEEATFCLLDQRTFECHWSTVQKLAAYKAPPNNKIELLYFSGRWLAT